MKVGPDSAQIARSSADFDLKAKKDWKECESDSSANAVQENDFTEGSDLRRSCSETEGEKREGSAFLPIRLKLNLL